MSSSGGGGGALVNKLYEKWCFLGIPKGHHCVVREENYIILSQKSGGFIQCY